MEEEILIDEMPVSITLPPIKVGADYSFTLEFEDDNEEPKDTTDWVMEIAGREVPNGAELFHLEIDSGITHTPSLGRFIIKISNTITTDLTVTKVYWDCKVTDNNDEITYPVQGIWDVVGSVTR